MVRWRNLSSTSKMKKPTRSILVVRMGVPTAKTCSWDTGEKYVGLMKSRAFSCLGREI